MTLAMRQRDLAVEELIQKELKCTKRSGLDTKIHQSTYTEKIGAEICTRVAFGQSLRFICSLEHMPTYWTLSQWLYGNVSEETEHGRYIQAFRQAYVAAQHAQMEMLGDEMIGIADEAHDRDSAAAAAIQLKAREFKLERLNPKRWAAATRTIEEETVEDFADKMAQALEVLAERKAQRVEVQRAEREALPAGGEGQDSD